MIQLIFGIKQVNVDQALQQAESKVDKSAKKMDKSLNNVGKNTSLDNVGKAMDNAKKGMESVNKFGGKLGNTMKNVVEGFKGMLSPIGLATAAITALISIGVSLWQKMTLSAEQYVQKTKKGVQRAKKAVQDLNKKEAQDNGYIDRLKQISQQQNISNTVKTQAISIIQLLTDRYGQLGISIDETTGKIVGLDGAMVQINKRMQQAKLDAKKLQVRKQQYNTGANVAVATDSKGSGVYTTFTPSTFGDGSKSESVSMASKWSGDTVYNNDVKGTKFLASDKVKDLADQWERQRKAITELQGKQKEGTISASEKQRLQNLKQQQKWLKKRIVLQQKLEVAERMMDKTASDPQQAKKWQSAAIAIQQLILKQQQLKNLDDAINSKNGKGLADRLKQINGNFEKNAEKKNIEQNTKQYQKQSSDLIQKQVLANAENDKKLDIYATKADKQSKDTLPFQQILANMSDGGSNDGGLQVYNDILEEKRERYKQIDKKMKVGVATDAEVQQFTQLQKSIKDFESTIGKRVRKNKEVWKRYNDLFKKNQQGKATDQQKIQLQGLDKDVRMRNRTFKQNRQRQTQLQKKQSTNSLTKDQMQQLVRLGQYLNQLQVDQAKASEVVARRKLQQRQTQIEILNLQKQYQQGLKNTKKAIDQQLQLQQLQKTGTWQQIERQKILNDLKNKGFDVQYMKKNGLFGSYDIDKEIDQILKKRKQLQQQKVYDDTVGAMDKEMQLLKLKIKGKYEQAERQKVINDLKAKGLAYDQASVDAIMKKKKDLAGLQMKSAFQDQGYDLLYKQQSKINKKQAEYDKRVRDTEKQYGVKLDKDQKDTIKQIIDLEFQIESQPKLDFKDQDIKSNELTQRGALGLAVTPQKDRINTQIMQYSARQVSLLSNIKTLLNNVGII